MRKRTTATERNRGRDAINPERFRVNPYSSDLLKSYKTPKELRFLPL
jgi:hypothetical protein